ncbi:MAG: hypothetical protein RI967_960 [Planctomycetota bacterium]
MPDSTPTFATTFATTVARGLAPDRGAAPFRVLRWLARLASLASLALLALFATSGGSAPSAFEWLLLAFFPIGVAIGTVLAWFREIAGGSVALVALVAFHALLLVDDGRPPAGSWFLVFTSPALVLLAVGIATRRAAVR